MIDERNNMKNCDVEPEYSNDMTPLQQLDEQGMRGAIIANNVRAFILHAVLAFISVPFVWGPPFAAPLAFVCYSYFTYRYFKLIPRMNFLSVAGPGVVLLMVTTVCYILLSSDTLHTLLWQGQPPLDTIAYLPAMINISGLLTVFTLGFLLFGYQGFSYYQQIGLDVFIAAFVPSLLMYLGLCFKICEDKYRKKHGNRKRKQKLPPRIQ